MTEYGRIHADGSRSGGQPVTEQHDEPVALKPCPFCGGEVERAVPTCSDLSEYIRHRHIENSSCPVEFTSFTLDGGDAMVAAWNTRPTPTADSAMVEAMADRAGYERGQRETVARIVAWLRKENGLCDCHARSEGECGCGAWDDYKQWPLERTADAIEAGDWE